MLTIRKAQEEVFDRAAFQSFEDQLVEHLRGLTPRLCEVLQENGVRRVIRFGYQRAKQYGLTNRGPVRFYIEQVLAFGCDFDTDPLLPWARKILTDPATPDQTVRAERLFQETMRYLDAVEGPNFEHGREALRRAGRERYDIGTWGGENITDVLLARLRGVHPRKCDYVGEPALRELIVAGIDRAGRYSVSSGAGVALFIGLMFALGHGFAADPVYPWIEATLTNASLGDPNRRAERLYAKVMTYLNHALAHMEPR